MHEGKNRDFHVATEEADATMTDDNWSEEAIPSTSPYAEGVAFVSRNITMMPTEINPLDWQSSHLTNQPRKRPAAVFYDKDGLERVKKLRPINSSPFMLMGPIEQESLKEVKELVEAVGRDILFLFHKGYDIVEHHVCDDQVRTEIQYILPFAHFYKYKP